MRSHLRMLIVLCASSRICTLSVINDEIEVKYYVYIYIYITTLVNRLMHALYNNDAIIYIQIIALFCEFFFRIVLK